MAIVTIFFTLRGELKIIRKWTTIAFTVYIYIYIVIVRFYFFGY